MPVKPEVGTLHEYHRCYEFDHEVPDGYQGIPVMFDDTQLNTYEETAATLRTRARTYTALVLSVRLTL